MGPDEDIQRLVARVVDDPSCDVGDSAVSSLLDALRAGLSLALGDRLARGDDRQVRIYAWLVSELGIDGLNAESTIAGLLNYPLPEVRFWCIDSVIACVGSFRPATTASALGLIRDDADVVRVAAVHLLASAPIQCLRAALVRIEDEDLSSEMNWLLSIDPNSSSEEIFKRASSVNELSGLVAVAAAGRMSNGRRLLQRIVEEAALDAVVSAARRLLVVYGSW